MYANVIIDISHEQIDRPFQYYVPESLEGAILVGKQVIVPFGNGNTRRRAYVIELTEERNHELAVIKEIYEISQKTVDVEQQMIALASWMRKEYGCTMIQALKTVIPVKEKVRQRENRIIRRSGSEETFETYYTIAQKKKWRGRLRVLDALKKYHEIPFLMAQKQLGVTAAILKPMEEAGVLTVDSEVEYRNPIGDEKGKKIFDKASNEITTLTLNSQQEKIVADVLEGYKKGIKTPCLIHGITGSGKTEVYIRLIEGMLGLKKSAIVLIPEISLTYQTVMRFYSRFGNIVSIVNSRLSQGEKYDQFERARQGKVQVMIGPRSALFTPFSSLGLIVIDEEQETAYKSEQVPRYHARETAIARAKMCGAVVVLGSATPSIEAYTRAKRGEYRLFTLTKRAVEGSRLADVAIVDLRKELKSGNRSVFSRLLQNRMEMCLEKNQQMMLFLNRRGYSKAVSCRLCGKPLGCPHCAVPLTEHVGQKLICHYCGYSIRLPKTCPSCGSPYLAGFGMGTEKVEQMVKERFPDARTIRMDYDTTSGKDGHEKILQAFSAHEADVLIGTQMIVKGHDFPGVTLVGILAADMSLYSGDFRSQERTYQLLVQAAGRAGRGSEHGQVIIQTYDPENYSIQAAAKQDYDGFFREESLFRQLMSYPPQGDMCEVLAAGQKKEDAVFWIREIVGLIQRLFRDTITIIGPCDAPIAKIKDYWRVHLFIKSPDHEAFTCAMEKIGQMEAACRKGNVYLSVTAL